MRSSGGASLWKAIHLVLTSPGLARFPALPFDTGMPESRLPDASPRATSRSRSRQVGTAVPALRRGHVGLCPASGQVAAESCFSVMHCGSIFSMESKTACRLSSNMFGSLLLVWRGHEDHHLPPQNKTEEIKKNHNTKTTQTHLAKTKWRRLPPYSLSAGATSPQRQDRHPADEGAAA